MAPPLTSLGSVIGADGRMSPGGRACLKLSLMLLPQRVIGVQVTWLALASCFLQAWPLPSLLVKSVCFSWLLLGRLAGLRCETQTTLRQWELSRQKLQGEEP